MQSLLDDFDAIDVMEIPEWLWQASLGWAMHIM